MKSFITNLKKNRNAGKKPTNKEILISLIIVSLLLYIERTNIIYCGSVADTTTVTQLQEFIHGLTDEEADEFARRIEFVPHQGWNVPHAEEVVSTNPIRWESVAIFVIATTALFLVARYGEIIRDVLFNLPSAQDIYTGMAQAMHNIGRATIFRQELATQAAQLLIDPETSRRLEFAIRAVRTMRS
jgi:hypothetical protein